MRRFTSIVFLLTSGLVAAQDRFAEKAAPFLQKYCHECHDEKESKGGIDVHTLTSTLGAYQQHQFLKSLASQVENRKMPPKDAEEHPSDDERKAAVSEIRAVLKSLEEGNFPRNPGRPTVRRLNRNEYNLTVRELFGIDFQAGREFPEDGAGGEGFDNVGDSLFVQPSLLEKYLSASKKVIESVYSSPERKSRVILMTPTEKLPPDKAARGVLTVQASLAFRRKVTDEELGPMLALFQKQLTAGASYEDALRLPLQSLLVHPSFLFRFEADQPGKTEWRISDFELASRLSYFLWASMPDRALFKLANDGKLSDPAVLRSEVLRMLADPKAEALSRYFGGQWLGFDELREVAEPDPKRFPTFTPGLRNAMYRESVEFFSNLVRANRPVLDLVSADYTFVNEELATHYGIPGVTGPAMRKVPLTDPNRGGVIGQASILTTTSMPLRTSPVKRGKWILNTLLGTPPPPPPPNAGVLPADDKSAAKLTFREQLEQHRKQPNCAGCHEKIDPLGFGLENFDAIGRWRSTDANGKPVDSMARLPGDITFSTPAELKKLLLGSDELFLRNIARKMLAYALGRPLEYYDEPVIVDLVKKLRQNDLKTQSLILSIVESHPFQNRSAKR